MIRPGLALAAGLALGFTRTGAAQGPPVGNIDLYGLRHVTAEQVRGALTVHPGDSVTPAILGDTIRLMAVPGVARAAVDAVCCEEGRMTIYVGIEEQGAPAITFDSAPTGNLRLPDEVLRAGAELDSVFQLAIEAGDFAEDDSQGHQLMHFPAARQVQEQFPALAARYADQLRAVLHQSADPEQRALAAQVLAYAQDKRAVVPDLVRAMRDPVPLVRNNATRALALIAGLARTHPQLGITVPYEPFVDLLNSLVWTDRNKSSLALMQLAEHGDAGLMRLLRARALPSLVEMARWKAPGHAMPAFIILGRLAGLSGEETFQAWQRGERERVIEGALHGQ